MLDASENRAWNILMIDDDEDDYLLTGSMLKQAKGRLINLDWAHTPQLGRDKLAGARYDAVLIDYDFGKTNGIDLIRELAAQHYPAPLILYTGRGSFEVDMEAMQAGATLYLPKADANPLMLERSIRYAIERKQSMDSLRESQERFRSVLENTQDIAYRRNLRTDRYDYLSLSSLQVLGYTPEEMNNMSIEEVLAHTHPDDREELSRGLERALEQGRARLIYRFLTRAGEYRWLADYVSIQKDENDQPLYRSGILRDITEQKEVEQALRESEQRFRMLVDHIAQLAWMSDADGNRFWFNQRWFDYTGTTLEQVMGWGWQIVHHPEHVQRVVEKMHTSFVSGTPFEDTYPLRDKHGQWHWFLSRVIPLRDDTGRVMRWLGTDTDVTEQLETEQSLRQSEERLRLALNGAQQGIWDWNIETNQIVWDERCYQIFGLPPGSPIIVEQLLEQVVHPDDRTNFSQAIIRLDPEHTVVEEEFRVVHANGEICWAFVKGQAYFDDAGKLTRVAGSVMDITSRRVTEERLKAYTEQLRTSNQMLEDFAFIASHDLQEPLRKVQSFGEILKDRYTDQLGEQGSDYINRMVNASARMSTMLAGLLAYSRVSTTRQPFVATDLRQVVEEVLTDLEVRIQQTGGEVKIGDLPVIQADPLQMRQLFQNLIGNALKFHRPGVPPLVEVDAHPVSTDRVTIMVSDNGMGFDLSHLNSLFLPFYRIHSHSGTEGSGIGLAICKKIIDRHHGEITAQSKPGQGATFTVSLPVQQVG